MSLFIDETSQVDREALQEYVLQKLQALRAVAEQQVYHPDQQGFWDKLHDLIVAEEDEKQRENLLSVESQLRGLVHFIDGWIQTAVDSQERFHFFVLTKASEMNSGDEKKDYYWALQIRHDQLVGMVRVLESLMELMQKWVKMEPEKVLEEGVFLGMMDVSVEEQIYLEAEKVAKEREQHMQRQG